LEEDITEYLPPGWNAPSPQQVFSKLSGSFSLRFAAVFRTLPRLRKVGVGILQHRILVAMAELVLQTRIAGRIMIGFRGAFGRILVGLVL
jgi:hypothetical protein